MLCLLLIKYRAVDSDHTAFAVFMIVEQLVFLCHVNCNPPMNLPSPVWEG